MYSVPVTPVHMSMCERLVPLVRMNRSPFAKPALLMTRVAELTVAISLRSVVEACHAPTSTSESLPLVEVKPGLTASSVSPVPAPSFAKMSTRPQPEPAMRISRSINWIAVRAFWRTSVTSVTRAACCDERKNVIMMPPSTRVPTTRATISSMRPKPGEEAGVLW